MVHLPANLSAFVGRQDELAQIHALLTDPACRLLTLVGPGGVGKTRLAVEAARRFDTPENVYFAPLQPLASPEFVLPTIADAVGLEFYPGVDPKQQLLDHLWEKPWLLVLDNFEHLLDGAELLSEILTYAPTLRILVTSRERLNLVEEWVLGVSGLAYPPVGEDADPERYSALQLFTLHARRAKVDFVLTETQRPAVARICRLVDGLPLGIELAAVWVRALSCAEIADEIERSLDILETPARNVAARHRTMRAALEPTWARLSDQERDVFKKLSVFRGGFRKEAAMQVAGASLPMLSTLVDKCLIQADPTGRYEVHELLRQYAADKLSESSTEVVLVQDRHSAYYAGFMSSRGDALEGRKHAETTREIEQEIDNVRAAWDHAVAHGNWREIELYRWSMLSFNYGSGRLREGETGVHGAIAALETGAIQEPKIPVLGQLYADEGFFSVCLGRFEHGRDLLNRSLAILRPLAAQRDIALSLIYLGATYNYLGAYAEAQTALQEAETLSRGLGDEFCLAWVLGNYAHLNQVMGHYDAARHQYQECVTLLNKSDELTLYVTFVVDFGTLLQRMGDYHEARRLLQIGLDVATELDEPHSISKALNPLAEVSLALGDDAQSCMYAHRALVIERKFGILPLILRSFLSMTGILLKQGDKERAVERLTLIVHHPATMQEIQDRAQALLDQLASEVPPEAFEASQERGKAAMLEPTLDALYDEPSFAPLRSADAGLSQAAVNRLAGTAIQPGPDGLSERELGVLRLMAEGLSNREIAAQLFLGVSTVKWYVSRILAKMGVTSRTQAVTHARRQGLLP